MRRPSQSPSQREVRVLLMSTGRRRVRAIPQTNAILTSSEVPSLSLSRVRALSLFTCMHCVRVFTYTCTRTQEEASTAATASYMSA